ncbi:MAG: acetate/propionate family kinase [Steroidobacteraceae bacterium]
MDQPTILCLNGGSSSIRFSVYRLAGKLEKHLHGKVAGVGVGQPVLRYSDTDNEFHEEPWPAPSHLGSAVDLLAQWLDKRGILPTISAVGHRVVHGMSHTEPELITESLLNELRSLQWLDPNHIPSEIQLIEAMRRRLPDRPHVACFDTAFHRDLPAVARAFAIPRRFLAQGVRRYGFHGLSYAYLVEELARVAGAEAAAERIVLAHLGNGASLTAVRAGKSIDTSMGFTPAGGIPMSSRSGDLDPGVLSYLQRTERLTNEAFDRLVNHESGLLGISETSSDMSQLLVSEATDARAAEAVALFCYQVKKCVGGYAATLGGLDTLVFSGGIGERAALVRARVCEGLAFLGIELDTAANDVNAAIISRNGARVTVRVIPTDEERMIARYVCRALQLPVSDEVHI